MAPSRDIDDAQSAATSVGDEVSVVENRRGGVNSILSQLFKGFEKDATGSVHRAWAACVLCMILFFIFAIIEGELWSFCCTCACGRAHSLIIYFNSQNNSSQQTERRRQVNANTPSGCLLQRHTASHINDPWDLCVKTILHGLYSGLLPRYHVGSITTKSAHVCGIL